MNAKQNRPVTSRAADGERIAGGESFSNSNNSTATKPSLSFDLPLRALVKVGGRVVGGIRGNNRRGLALTKDVSGSIHFLRRPPAIALDLGSIEQAEALGASRAEIRDLETGIVYLADLATFRARGARVSRGAGTQVALPLAAFKVVCPDGRVLDPETPGGAGFAKEEFEPAQLTLFAEALAG